MINNAKRPPSIMHIQNPRSDLKSTHFSGGVPSQKSHPAHFLICSFSLNPAPSSSALFLSVSPPSPPPPSHLFLSFLNPLVSLSFSPPLVLVFRDPSLSVQSAAWQIRQTEDRAIIMFSHSRDPLAECANVWLQEGCGVRFVMVCPHVTLHTYGVCVTRGCVWKSSGIT